MPLTPSSPKFHQALHMSTDLCFLHVICYFLFALACSLLLFLYFTVLANVFWKVLSVQAVPFGETQSSEK